MTISGQIAHQPLHIDIYIGFLYFKGWWMILNQLAHQTLHIGIYIGFFYFKGWWMSFNKDIIEKGKSVGA
jgi:hypothetical protein